MPVGLYKSRVEAFSTLGWLLFTWLHLEFLSFIIWLVQEQKTPLRVIYINPLTSVLQYHTRLQSSNGKLEPLKVTKTIPGCLVLSLLKKIIKMYNFAKLNVFTTWHRNDPNFKIIYHFSTFNKIKNWTCQEPDCIIGLIICYEIVIIKYYLSNIISCLSNNLTPFFHSNYLFTKFQKK